MQNLVKSFQQQLGKELSQAAGRRTRGNHKRKGNEEVTLIDPTRVIGIQETLRKELEAREWESCTKDTGSTWKISNIKSPYPPEKLEKYKVYYVGNEDEVKLCPFIKTETSDVFRAELSKLQHTQPLTQVKP